MAKVDPGSIQFKFMVNGVVSAGQVNLTADLLPMLTAIGNAKITPSQFSALVTPAAPTNTVAPSITGSAVVGGTLTGNRGTWTGSPTFTDAWTKDNVVIIGAVSPTYTPVTGDATHAIRYKPSATNAAGGPVTATSSPVTVAAAPSGVAIANAAALTAMFAAGVGASGGKTYNLAGTSFGTFFTQNIDFTSNPVIIVGQSGTVFDALQLSNVKGVTWSTFNILSATVGLDCENGCAHLTFNNVTFQSGTALGTQAGQAIKVRDSSFITFNGANDSAISDISGCSNAAALLDSSNITFQGMTISNNGVDGIIYTNIATLTFNQCLGFDFFSNIAAGDHPDFLQGFGTTSNVTISNCGFLQGAGNPSQGYTLEGTSSNTIFQSNYTYGGLLNSIQQSGGTTTLIDNNFLQGFGINGGSRIIVRDGSVNCTVTNNSAGAIANYAGGGINPGFVPAVLPGSNTIIADTTPGNFTALDAWLAANPSARARP